jgi:hypothetical protein
MQGIRGRAGASRAIGVALGALLALACISSSAWAAAPALKAVGVGEVSSEAAVFVAEINPEGTTTHYRFEYGTGPCSGSCASVPVGEGEVPAGSSAKLVKAPVGGLSPLTIYHYRLVANNGQTTTSADHIFATYGPSLEGLPDNRAYEQSSPLNKDGGDAAGQRSVVKATEDGDGISFNSSFGMPGGKGAQAQPSFLAMRGEGEEGWSTQGLLPPVSVGQRAKIIGWTPDYSQIYSRATRLGNPRTQALVAQPSTGGEPVVIAPYAVDAEDTYVDSSADGSIVFFEAKAKLPPKEGGTPIAAAIEGAPNLYVWDGESEEVRLAGAMNTLAESQAILPKGAIAGPYAWSNGTTARTVGEGGAERNSYLRDMHAVTPDGDVYFTAAGSGQLYLRENPAQPQSPLDGEGKCTDPSLACTIHVSASQKTNGQGEGGTDPVGPQPAAFQAASADGSEVFFTSHEKLTDEANTGPEQQKAAIARTAITGGGIEDPEFIPKAAVGVTVDGTYVYWANPALGSIGRAKLNGEEVDPNFIAVTEGECEMEFTFGEEEEKEFRKVTIPASPRYVAVDGEYIYWTNSGREDPLEGPLKGGGTIGRAKLNGETVEDIDPDFICGEDSAKPGERFVSNPQGIAVNASHLYWANAGQGLTGSTIARAAIDGSAVEGKFAEVGTINGRVAYGVGLSASHVYFDTNEEINNFGYIAAVTLEGGERKERFVGEAKLRGLAVDAGHVYWVSQSEGAIGRADLELESREKEFVKTNGKVNGLAADGAHLYWSVNGEAATNPGNDLYRYRPATGELSDLSVLPGGNGAEVQGVLGVSGDGSRVYFAANGVLAAGASQGSCKGTVQFPSGECNLYAWEEGQVSFVARLDVDPHSGTESDALNWVGSPYEVLNSGFYAPKTSFLSADGKTLVFRSQNQLGEYENQGTPEYYRYRAGDGLRCLTCNPSGETAKGGPALNSIVMPFELSDAVSAVSSRNLAADGDHFFFESAEALSPQDTNGQGPEGCPFSGRQNFPACLDVYEWAAPGTTSCQGSGPSYSPLTEGCIFLISTGKSEFPSLFADASKSGNDVFFFTRQQLVGQDEDELQDVYDARVNGGLASQNEPPPPPPCESPEACHGPAQTPPVESSPATANFSGPGNQVEKHKPQKPHKKKHHKKKHHHKKAKQGKAKTKGRTQR